MSIAPAYWGFTGGDVWYGLAGGVAVEPLVVPQIVGIVLAVNQYELVLAADVLSRVDPCSAPFVEDVIDTHRQLTEEYQAFASEQSSSQVLEQIQRTAGSASEQFEQLSGADLGRAFVFNERVRAEQMLDLIDNRMGDALGDPNLGPALEQLREAYAERIDLADEVAQSCGYPPIELQ